LAEKAGTYVQLIAKCVQFFHWTVEWLRTCCVYYGKKYIQYYHGSPSFTRGKFGWSLCSTYFRFEWSRKIQELNSIKRLKKTENGTIEYSKTFTYMKMITYSIFQIADLLRWQPWLFQKCSVNSPFDWVYEANNWEKCTHSHSDTQHFVNLWNWTGAYQVFGQNFRAIDLLNQSLLDKSSYLAVGALGSTYNLD
jgi:hypothetical protein